MVIFSLPTFVFGCGVCLLANLLVCNIRGPCGIGSFLPGVELWLSGSLTWLGDRHLVLVRVSIAVVKHHGQSKLGRKGLILLTLPRHCSSLKEVRTGAQT